MQEGVAAELMQEGAKQLVSWTMDSCNFLEGIEATQLLCEDFALLAHNWMKCFKSASKSLASQCLWLTLTAWRSGRGSAQAISA